MNDGLTRLFNDFDRGTISRRQLLQALGLAAVGAALPVSVFGQGRCGGRGGAAGCDTIPARLPFEPTGWKTVSMDHFTRQCVDYKREVSYYATLMNWKVRSDDGTHAVVDIGDNVGTVIIRGGYEPPPPPPARADTGGGRGGGGRGGGRGQRAPRHAAWDSFCWGIEPWDEAKVSAELEKRGIAHQRFDDAGFTGLSMTDPGGFTLKLTDGKARARRRTAKTVSLPAPAPFEATNWNTVWLDHISFQCPNYKESTAFYTALLGWKPTGDEGSQNETEIGDLGNIIIRGGGGPPRGADSTGGRGGGGAPPRRVASIDHIAFGIQPWDPQTVRAELEKRGLNARADTGGKGDIMTASYQSYHTTTPDGFDLQISNATRERREVR